MLAYVLLLVIVSRGSLIAISLFQNFRRRSEDFGDDQGHAHGVDECESSGLGDILSQAHTLVNCSLVSFFAP
jgi:hypothetical protein